MWPQRGHRQATPSINDTIPLACQGGLGAHAVDQLAGAYAV